MASIEFNCLNLFGTAAFIGGYTMYVFFNTARKSIFDNIKEINALKIRVNRIVYCHEQILTKIIDIENKINSLIVDKNSYVDKETLTDKETFTDKEDLTDDNDLCENHDSVNIDNWNCMDKSINVDDACQELFITIPKPSRSWFTQIYS